MCFRRIRDDLSFLFSLFCLLYTVLIFSGCATSEDVGRVEWRLNDLRSDVNAIEKKMQSMEARLPSEKGQFKGLEESQKATARAVSDLLIKTQALRRDVQRITGQLEEVQYASEKSLRESMESRDLLAAQISELNLAVNEMKKRLDQLEQASAGIGKEKESQAKSGEKEKVAKPDVKDIYMAAYDAYKKGNTKEARDKFMSLLKDYPENEYSDNARFWIAESYYKDENYEDAILAYEELFRKNPDSEKIPGAMLKQGLAFYALKDKKTGQLILERLIEKFPDSEQAKIAKKKLSES